MFNPPTRPTAYLTIPDNSTSVVRSPSKTVHKPLWHNFKLHKAAERGCCAFIIDAVEDIWICGLQHNKTIYSNVTSKALIDNLQLCCGGIHAINIVEITSEMLTYYSDLAGVPKYINMIEDAQKKAQQAQPPILDVTLVAIATKLILQSQ